MDKTIVNIDSKELIVRTIRTNNKDEANSETAKITPLWQEAFEAEFCKQGQVAYGIYHNYASDFEGDYDVSVGIEPHADTEGEILQLAGGRYLKFTSPGELPKAVIDGWYAIWEYFAENQTYKRSYYTDFEKYTPDFLGVDIYIGIE